MRSAAPGEPAWCAPALGGQCAPRTPPWVTPLSRVSPYLQMGRSRGERDRRNASISHICRAVKTGLALPPGETNRVRWRPRFTIYGHAWSVKGKLVFLSQSHLLRPPQQRRLNAQVTTTPASPATPARTPTRRVILQPARRGQLPAGLDMAGPLALLTARRCSAQLGWRLDGELPVGRRGAGMKPDFALRADMAAARAWNTRSRSSCDRQRGGDAVVVRVEERID